MSKLGNSKERMTKTHYKLQHTWKVLWLHLDNSKWPVYSTTITVQGRWVVYKHILFAWPVFICLDGWCVFALYLLSDWWRCFPKLHVFRLFSVFLSRSALTSLSHQPTQHDPWPFPCPFRNKSPTHAYGLYTPKKCNTHIWCHRKIVIIKIVLNNK